MHKYTYILLSGSLLMIFLLLFFLIHSANLPNNNKNGFERNWLPGSLRIVERTKVNAPLEKIVGVSTQNIFFNVPNPHWIITYDRKLDKDDTLKFGLPSVDGGIGPHACYVDSPIIYFCINNIPSILLVKMNSNLVKVSKIPTNLVTKSAYLSPGRLVLRAFDSSQQNQIFQKVDASSGTVIRQAEFIESSKDDVGFSTDGMLQFDNISNRLLYVQYYQNRFYCLDTNLNLLYRSNTIDTIASNTIDIEQIRTNDKDMLMPAASRLLVNRMSYAFNGFLYVNSTLLSDNEDKTKFRKNSVIDIYLIDDGSYYGSFYVPNLNGEKIKDFVVVDNQIIILYKKNIVIFNLPDTRLK